MRIRIIKDHKQYKKGDIVEVSPNVGFGLLDGGIGVVSKDVTAQETATKKRHGQSS